MNLEVEEPQELILNHVLSETFALTIAALLLDNSKLDLNLDED